MATRTKKAPVDPASGFPLRVGVVDMGSNAIRIVTAEFLAPLRYTELLTDRVPIRLGHTVYQTGRLEPAAMDAAVRTMLRFRQILDELEITQYRAVATSAVRESANGPALQKRIREEANVRLDIITGAEEARLVCAALPQRLAVEEDPWILADLGGGSLEVALVNGAGMLTSESHTIGSLRLHEEFEASAGNLKAFSRLLDESLGALRIPALSRYPDPVGFAATGGNMEDLARLAGAERNAAGVSVVTVKALEGVIERLAGLTVAERVAQLGLREDRADVILPAAMVYARLARLVGQDQIHVPYVGVRDGVMHELVANVAANAG